MIGFSDIDGCVISAALRIIEDFLTVELLRQGKGKKGKKEPSGLKLVGFPKYAS